MRRAAQNGGRIRGGFTLIEVMVSVALIGILLVGLDFFVFSMGELWGKSGDRRLLDQHVEAVTRYLKREFRIAGLPPANAPVPRPQSNE